jgi:membrane associated rhomboid family serine protease
MMTYTLIAINVLVFIWEVLTLQNEGQVGFERILAAIAFNVCEIGVRPLPSMALDGLRSMFLHGSLLHIAGNMLFLWVFGRKIEAYFGAARYAGFYLAAGYAATLGHLLFGGVVCTPGDPYGIVIGASGAVAGVMGAFLLLHPAARIKTLVSIFPSVGWQIQVPAVFYLLYWFVLDLLQGIGWFGEQGSQVAHWAHIVGFLFGFVLVFFSTMLWEPAPKVDPFEYLDE